MEILQNFRKPHFFLCHKIAVVQKINENFDFIIEEW